MQERTLSGSAQKGTGGRVHIIVSSKGRGVLNVQNKSAAMLCYRGLKDFQIWYGSEQISAAQ